MRILVLGGTKYFGKRLVNLLLEEGHQVSVGSTGKTEVKFIKPVERLTLDRKDPGSMWAATKGKTWDVVYDQICFTADEAKITEELFSGNIGHLVFTSTQSVYEYGVDMKEAWFDPTGYVPKTDNPNTYQEGKRLAEKAYSLQKGFPVTAVRFPLVLGTEDPTGRLHWHISKIKNGAPIFFPNVFNHVTVISADEAAKFLKWLVDKGWHEPLNACSPDPLRLFDLVKMIEMETGSSFLEGTAEHEAEASPYGVEKDWCMSPQKAIAKGFSFTPVDAWLPALVKEEVPKVPGQEVKQA